jgi:hypothetical protein
VEPQLLNLPQIPLKQALNQSAVGLMGCLVLSLSSFACAQGSAWNFGDQSRPVVGSTGGIARPQQPPIMSGSTDLMPRRHLKVTGQPCVSLYASAKSQLTNRNIFDHLVFGTNECAQMIKLRICYYKTSDCIQMDLPPYGRKEMTLGIFPSIKDFQFEFREQF